jgi:hypothetical protein
MISIRKLAAVDIIGLGSRIIIGEFAVGAVAPLSLGVWTLVRSSSIGGRLFGAYLVALAINYVPLLFYAIQITRRNSASTEIADESPERSGLFRKYRRVSLLLLLPAVVPLLAIIESWRQSQVHRTPDVSTHRD